MTAFCTDGLIQLVVGHSIQRPAKKGANLAMQDPGRDWQKNQARTGRHISQLPTIFLSDICISTTT